MEAGAHHRHHPGTADSARRSHSINRGVSLQSDGGGANRKGVPEDAAGGIERGAGQDSGADWWVRGSEYVGRKVRRAVYDENSGEIVGGSNVSVSLLRCQHGVSFCITYRHDI